MKWLPAALMLVLLLKVWRDQAAYERAWREERERAYLRIHEQP